MLLLKTWFVTERIFCCAIFLLFFFVLLFSAHYLICKLSLFILFNSDCWSRIFCRWDCQRILNVERKKSYYFSLFHSGIQSSGCRPTPNRFLINIKEIQKIQKTVLFMINTFILVAFSPSIFLGVLAVACLMLIR